jgi:hypothetical protein
MFPESLGGRGNQTRSRSGRALACALALEISSATPLPARVGASGLRDSSPKPRRERSGPVPALRVQAPSPRPVRQVACVGCATQRADHCPLSSVALLPQAHRSSGITVAIHERLPLERASRMTTPHFPENALTSSRPVNGGVQRRQIGLRRLRRAGRALADCP